MAKSVTTLVASEGASSLDDLARTADFWNAQAGGTGTNSKFVDQIHIDRDTGEIEITLNSDFVGLGTSANIIYLSPYIRTSATASEKLVDAIDHGTSGAIDWACSSATQNTANDRGMLGAPIGSVPANLAPAECR
ncbi:pilin [Agitococcus lubricus]|uniref:Type IV pilus assembly protein PilA n=1 Tax=Agitococcus lubricus TaxID=1077255 RepID=A0A2T5ITW3_9GAMM|nr:pilin [Agitococcus lubricus]PTQ87241.1 type IV pilus assembly protein PilA [Agitococcus lubricus]